MSWTQSICAACWNERYPNQKAHAIVPLYADEETCCYCGEPTTDGIYIRVDPSVVPFPSVSA